MQAFFPILVRYPCGISAYNTTLVNDGAVGFGTGDVAPLVVCFLVDKTISGVMIAAFSCSSRTRLCLIAFPDHLAYDGTASRFSLHEQENGSQQQGPTPLLNCK